MIKIEQTDIKVMIFLLDSVTSLLWLIGICNQLEQPHLSNVIFIYDCTSRFCAIRHIVPRFPVLYDCLSSQRVFAAEHKRWQPYCIDCYQLSSAVFFHSKVRKGMVDQTSKDNFLIVYCRIIRMWWRTLFLVLWSQNPSTLLWTWFLASFQPWTGAVDHLQPFKVEESSGQTYI